MRKSGLLALALATATSLTVLAAEKPPAAHVEAMKALGGATNSLRQNIQAKNYDGVSKDAATLKTTFATVEQFWTARKADDAIAAAKAGAKAAGDLATAATAKNDAGIAAAQQAIGGSCQSCHTAHRERLPDGTSEIK